MYIYVAVYLAHTRHNRNQLLHLIAPSRSVDTYLYVYVYISKLSFSRYMHRYIYIYMYVYTNMHLHVCKVYKPHTYLHQSLFILSLNKAHLIFAL